MAATAVLGKPPRKVKEWRRAPEVEAIAEEFLQDEGYDDVAHLHGAGILYLMTTAEKVGKDKAANASLFPPRLRIFGDYQFIVEVSFPIWETLTEDQRKALVYHELLHCDVDEETTLPIIREHDIQEFHSVLRRYGLWTPQLVTAVRQLGLFVDDDGQITVASTDANVTEIRPVRKRGENDEDD